MNTDELKTHVMTLCATVLAWLAGRYHLSPDQTGAIMSDLSYLGTAAALVGGVWAHWNMKKVPEMARVVPPAVPNPASGSVTTRMLFPLIFILLVCLIGARPARAADMNTKAAPAMIVPAPALSMAGWSGFYVGASVTGVGNGLSLTDLGSITANGNLLGAEIGYETYNGMTLLGARAGGGYNVSSAGNVPIGSRGAWHAGVMFGGNLAALFNLPQPQFPALFMNAVPYVAIEGCGNRGLDGACSSIGAEGILPNSRGTIFVEYTNWKLNGATDNSIGFGYRYHF